MIDKKQVEKVERLKKHNLIPAPIFIFIIRTLSNVKVKEQIFFEIAFLQKYYIPIVDNSENTQNRNTFSNSPSTQRELPLTF